MRSPFPGMDPWLEQSGIWSNLHTTLITALRDTFAQSLRPHYYVDIDQRAYITSVDDHVNGSANGKLVGRPDVNVIKSPYLLTALPPKGGALSAVMVAEPTMVEVASYEHEETIERYLEVRKPKTGQVVTVIEILSPKNKRSGEGRAAYLLKRDKILTSQTHLVEIDLLRAGEPMPVVWRDKKIESHYRILVSRAPQRPESELYPFMVRDAMPRFRLPLLPGDDEPIVDLSKLLHDIYERAGYDLVIDYEENPSPRFRGEDAEWVDKLLKEKGMRD